jgi:hypothetical protein
MRNAHKIMVEKSERERPLRRPKCRWEGVETDLKEIGWDLI